MYYFPNVLPGFTKMPLTAISYFHSFLYITASKLCKMKTAHVISVPRKSSLVSQNPQDL